MTSCLATPPRSLAEVRAELLQRMEAERAVEPRACTLISALNTLAMLDDEIAHHRARYRPYEGAA